MTPAMTARGTTARPELPRVRRYWDAALHEQVLSAQPVGLAPDDLGAEMTQRSFR